MSIEKQISVTCPKCGSEINTTYWQSLNGDINPEAKQLLLDGQLFRVLCGSCGITTQVHYPILYHDMTHNVMIQYAISDNEDAYKKMFEDVIK